MSDSFEYRRRIRWGDTDAAGIVYTANYFDLCMEAIEEWFIATIEADWFSMNLDHHMGTPFVHAEVDFKAPMTPRDTLLISVKVERLGHRSLSLALTGRSELKQSLAFTGLFTCCFTDTRTFQPIPVPEAIRKRIEGSPELSTKGGITAR